jgi:Fe-Mn family superoxide dismutase
VGTLRVFALDEHDVGAVFGHTVVCAIDVYEHSFWMDFGTAKAAYLDRLYGALNWDAIAKR